MSISIDNHVDFSRKYDINEYHAQMQLEYVHLLNIPNIYLTSSVKRPRYISNRSKKYEHIYEYMEYNTTCNDGYISHDNIKSDLNYQSKREHHKYGRNYTRDHLNIK